MILNETYLKKAIQNTQTDEVTEKKSDKDYKFMIGLGFTTYGNKSADYNARVQTVKKLWSRLKDFFENSFFVDSMKEDLVITQGSLRHPDNYQFTYTGDGLTCYNDVNNHMNTTVITFSSSAILLYADLDIENYRDYCRFMKSFSEFNFSLHGISYDRPSINAMFFYRINGEDLKRPIIISATSELYEMTTYRNNNRQLTWNKNAQTTARQVLTIASKIFPDEEHLVQKIRDYMKVNPYQTMVDELTSRVKKKRLAVFDSKPIEQLEKFCDYITVLSSNKIELFISAKNEISQKNIEMTKDELMSWIQESGASVKCYMYRTFSCKYDFYMMYMFDKTMIINGIEYDIMCANLEGQNNLIISNNRTANWSDLITPLLLMGNKLSTVINKIKNYTTFDSGELDDLKTFTDSNLKG